MLHRLPIIYLTVCNTLLHHERNNGYGNINEDVVLFLLDESQASKFYVLTFRNTLLHLHRRCKQEE